MYRKRRKGWMKHVDFLLLNQICLHVSFVLAYCMRHGFDELPYEVDIYRNIAVVLSGTDLLIALLFNTLHNVLKRGYYKEAAATVKHVLLVFMCMAVYLFSVKQAEDYSRLVFYATLILYAASNYVVRVLWKKALSKRVIPKTRSMLLVTYEALAGPLIADIAARPSEAIEIAGLAILDRDLRGQNICGVPVVAIEEDAASYVCREWIDEVFIHIPMNDRKPLTFIRQCSEMGITVHLSMDDQQLHSRQQFVERLAGHTVLTNTINSATPLQAFLKRAMDILGGLVGCVIAGIVLLIVGPVIRKNSPGPVVFSQERIGLNGRKFKFYKIRSMYLDAEERKAELMKENRVNDGMMFKLDFDPRIIGNETLPDGTRKTGIGEYIRKYSLDELPQFWNVLKGDMSLVGTRPPTVDEWEKYKLHHRARLAMKPGITGMWQVSGRSDITDFEEVVKLDMEYICNWSMGLDFRILFKTIGAVIMKRGAM